MFAAIYVPDFMVEAIVRLRPTLRHHAVAVIEGTPPLAYVVAANDHARQLGMSVGMTRLQAENLAALHMRNTREQDGAMASNASAPKGDPRFHLVRDAAHMSNAQENGWTIAHVPDEVSEHPRHTSSYQRATRPRSPRASQNTRKVAVTLCRRAPQQETAAHAALLDAAHALSPRVEDTATDIVLIDVAGLERLFGSSQSIARELGRLLACAGLEANIAVASNPDCAMHAARGFSGITLIPAGREPERLGELPIEILGVNYTPAETKSRAPHTSRASSARGWGRSHPDDTRKRLAQIIDTLDRWGIRNFRALAALPPSSLAERLGPDGVHLQQLAAGSVRRDLVTHEAPLVFEETAELEYPIELLESLSMLLECMTEQVCARLAARSLSTTELHLHMELEHRSAEDATLSPEELAQAAQTAHRKITLPVPMNDARLFLKLLQMELQANPPGAPVTKVRLTAEPARPRVAQTGLFVPLAPEPEKLELTLARIYRVLRGTTPTSEHAQLRAGSAELIDTHQPDAFRMVRFNPAAQSDESVARETTLLPMRVYRPPLPAEVVVRDGRPVRVVCVALGVKSATVDNLVWVAGPWRMCGNWWMEGEEPQLTARLKSHSDTNNLNNPAQAKGGLERATENSGERRTENGERNFSREEWDVALAITTVTEGKRQTQIALYRIYRDAAQDAWYVAGSYD